MEQYIAKVTEIMREADQLFQTTGGSTRHYVRDLLLPMLEQAGLKIVDAEPSPAKAEQEGPWVKASDRLPEIADGVTKLKIDGKEAEGVWSATEQAFIVGGHRYPPTLYYIEWLDEKKRREQEGPRWIDCKDELPKESGRYWCYVEEVNDLGISHFQWNCCYSANDDRWSDNLQTMNVTHWMPLPKAPSESATLPVKGVEHMGLSWIDANAYPPPEEGYYFALPMSIAYYHADKKKWDRTITHYGKKQSTPPVKEAGQPISQDAHEKEVMMAAFDKVVEIFERRSWIMEGRGPYAYNDDEYRKEVSYLYDEWEVIRKDTWANIKSKSFEYRKQIIDNYLSESRQQPAGESGWISIEDKPLYIDTALGWECTEDGEKDFIAAVPYWDTKGERKLCWWIRHCCFEDRTGLCVVGDDENIPAGWHRSAITHWKPWPAHPEQLQNNKP